MTKIIANKTSADAVDRSRQSLSALGALTMAFRMLRGYAAASSIDETSEETFVKLLLSTTDYNGFNLTDITCAISHAVESPASTQENAAYLRLQDVVVSSDNSIQGMDLLYVLNSLSKQHTNDNKFVFSPALGYFTGVAIALPLGDNKEMSKSELVEVLWLSSVTSAQHFNASINSMMATVDRYIKEYGLGSLAPQQETAEPEQPQPSSGNPFNEFFADLKTKANLAVIVNSKDHTIMHAWCCMTSKDEVLLSQTVEEIVGCPYDEIDIKSRLSSILEEHPLAKLIGLEINVQSMYI